MKSYRIFLLLIGIFTVFALCAMFTGCGKADTSENTESIQETETSEESNEQETTEIESLNAETTVEAGSEATTALTEQAAAAVVKSSSTSTNNKTAAKNSVSSNTANTGNRIIATSAAVCDIMDRLGIELVGVPETSVSNIASRYANVTRVGSPMEPDMEIIKTLKPTDVIGPDTLEADLKIKYDNIGVKSTFVNLRSVQGLYDTVRLIGDKYGKKSEADAIINEYNTFIKNYSSGHEGEAKPKVLVLMGLPGSYLVATQNSYAGSLVELAGGVNVFHDESKDFLNVNTEEILAKDPDVIIRTAHGLPKEALEMFEKEFSTNDIWKHFRAVKNGKVYDVDYMLFGMSATFDYPQALADLEPMLYGD